MIDVDDAYEYSPLVSAKIAVVRDTWSVYPNPSDGTFTVAIDRGHSAKNLMIVDHLGRVVYQKNIQPDDRYLDLAPNLSAGVYKVIIVGDDITSKSLVVMP